MSADRAETVRSGAVESSTTARPGRSGRDTAALLVLTLGAASTDAMCYLGLGRVFPANMTGNTVLLAINFTSGAYGAALRSLLALAGFVFGAIVAATVVLPAASDRWSRRAANCLLLELAALVGGTIWWVLTPRDPAGGAAHFGVIALFGMAMGIQSGTAAHLDVPASTTYITGTWTQVSSWIAAQLPGRRHRSAVTRTDRADHHLQAAVLAVYLATALAVGALFQAAGRVAALVPCVAIAGVCVDRLGRPGRPDR